MSGRAVVVSPHPGTDAGGTERFCNQVAAILGRLGFEVRVVGPDLPPRWLAEHGGASLWQARSARRAAGDANLSVTTGFLGSPGGWGGQRVHAFLGNMVRQAGSLGGVWHWRLRWGAAGGLAEALGARGATVVAGCRQAAEDARRLYCAKVQTVLPLGVDTDLFRPRERSAARRRLGLDAGGRYALFVGRGEPGKGPDVALAACRRAGYELLAAGARPVAGSRPLGILAATDLAEAYAAADAVVLPTRYEGFGFVAVEALASGVPIVTTPTGWARDLGDAVPSYGPLLVPPEVDAVTGALTSVGTAETEAATAAARAYVLEHNTMAAFERRFTDLLTGMGVL